MAGLVEYGSFRLLAIVSFFGFRLKLHNFITNPLGGIIEDRTDLDKHLVLKLLRAGKHVSGWVERNLELFVENPCQNLCHFLES